MTRLRSIYNELVSGIEIYDKEEAGEMVFLLMEKFWEVSRTDLIMGETNAKADEFEQYIKRINTGEPVQYILGEAWFRGRKFKVNENVLIPRPETEELVENILAHSPKTILDLGTGSGCIPVSLALEMPEAGVFAVDLSGKALEVAQENARNSGAEVSFGKADILDFKNPFETEKFDLIVSNPPYVKDSEKLQMRKNVLDFEPHLALFVKDNDPLLFYKAIGQIGMKYLTEGGTIWLEINSQLAEETKNLYREMGYSHQRLVRDFYEKERFLEVKQ